MSEREAPVWDTGRGEFARALREYDQWMAVEIGDDDVKRPKAPWADDPARRHKWARDATDNWTTFEQAHDWFDKVPNCPAIAFIMQSPDDPYTDEADPFLFIDGDKVRLDDGSVHPAFAALIDGLGDTFCEASVSGTGVHALYDGTLPEGYETGFAFDLPDHDDFPEAHVEVYHGKRVCICTGHRVQSMPDEVRPVDTDALATLCEDKGGDPAGGYDPEAERNVDDEAVQTAHDTPATDQFDVVLDAIAGLTIDDVRLDSVVTGERTDGWLDMDPSFANSDTGKRIGVAPNRRRVVYRDGNHGGDVLALVAWEERLADPGDELRGKAFWDAIRAARERGAPIPVHSPSEQTDAHSDDDSAAEGIDAESAKPDTRSSGGAQDSHDDEDEPAAIPTDADSRDEAFRLVKTQFASVDDAEERKMAMRLAGDAFASAYDWVCLSANSKKGDHLYYYDEETGLFHPHGETRLRSLVYEWLDQYASRHTVKEVTDSVKAQTTIHPNELEADQRLIPVANGVIDVRDGFTPGERELLAHSPEFRLTKRAETEYDPDADCPRFEQFLDEVTRSGTARKKLQEYAGYCLLRGELPYHKALFVVGPTRSGKSTFIDAIKGVLEGDTAGHSSDTTPTASLTLQEMTGERFKAHGLFGAWVNFRSELPPDIVTGRDRFKEMIGGDTIQVERKFKDSWDYNPTAKHIFAANELPEVEGADDAFYERLLLVSFPRTIPRPDRDPTLGDKLADERSGILNWMLDGLERLMTNGEFTADLVPALTRETWEKWGNSVKRFYDDSMEPASGNYIAAQEVYDAYTAWCENENVPARSYSDLLDWFVDPTETHDGSPRVRKEKKYFKDRGGHRSAFLGVEFTDAGLELFEDGDDDPATFW